MANKTIKGVIKPANEKKLAKLARKADIKKKMLKVAIWMFGGTIIKLFDNVILDKLPDSLKEAVAPIVNELIEGL